MSSSPLRYFVVDAFTDRPFTGNPAAVVPLDAWRDDAWLRNIAMEMNLSETAFLVPNDGGYDLRWFTPEAEVDLCGHATIATSVVLAHLDRFDEGSRIAFSTRSGTLTSERDGNCFRLDFPALAAEPCEPPAGLLEALGVDASAVCRSRFDYLVEVASESLVRGVTPDARRLASVECRGVVVTARGENGRHDFVSRFFAPAVGIDEDPVTGSAHCILAPYWGARLGRTRMLGYQASRRGGTVDVELHDDRVLLGGEGVLFASGELVGG